MNVTDVPLCFCLLVLVLSDRPPGFAHSAQYGGEAAPERSQSESEVRCLCWLQLQTRCLHLQVSCDDLLQRFVVTWRFLWCLQVLELTKEWTNKWNETQNILKVRMCVCFGGRRRTALQFHIHRSTSVRVLWNYCSGFKMWSVWTRLQEETLALRKEGIGVVLDSELPHLIGIDDDLLSTGIILYHLKVRETPETQRRHRLTDFIFKAGFVSVTADELVNIRSPQISGWTEEIFKLQEVSGTVAASLNKHIKTSSLHSREENEGGGHPANI